MEGWACSSGAFANSWEALGLIHRNTEGRRRKREGEEETGGKEKEEEG